MELKNFVEKHSLRVKRSREDDTDNIIGKYGEIYEYGDGALCLSDHFKSGQRLSLQNRPTGLAVQD
jgi:hypothetical protein